MRKLLISLITAAALLPALPAGASLLSDYKLRNDADMRARVTSAILVAAINIEAEDPQTANHPERLAWAQSLTTDGEAEAMARRFMVRLAANSTVSSAYAAELDHTDVVDGDIQFVVNGLVDLFALALFPQDP